MTAVPGAPVAPVAPGHEDLARALVDRYEAVRRFAAVAADRDIDPDDVVQEVFARLLRSVRAGGAVPSAMDAYLRRSAMNLLANERRSRGRARAALRRVEPPAAGAVDGYPSDVLDVLDRVEPIDRALLFLVDVERQAIGDAAATVGLSAVAARARLSRVRKRLVEELRAELAGETGDRVAERGNDEQDAKDER